jgi:hypothetical protein
MVKTSCIALQCPLTGGDGVFEARSMLGDLLEVDDEIVCQPELKLQVKELPITVSASAIQPNPASKFIRLFEQTGKNYLITNQYGSVVGEGILTSEYIETAAFASGIYTVTLWDANTRAVTHKFVIINE